MLSDERLIEIRLSKCVLVLTESELYHLLRGNPELWETGITRGKAIRRSREQRRREINKSFGRREILNG